SVSFDNGRFAISFSDNNKLYILVADEKTGKVFYTKSIKCRGEIAGIITGDSVIYKVSDLDAPENETTVCSENVVSGEQWQQVISEYIAGNILCVNNNVYLYDEINIAVLNKKTGKFYKIHQIDGHIGFAWEHDDMPYFLLLNGDIYTCDRETAYSINEFVYYYDYSDDITYAKGMKVINDDLYICPQSVNYVVKLAIDKAENAKKLSDNEVDNLTSEDNEDDEADPREILEHKTDINKALLVNAIFSDDKKLIMAWFRNYTVGIYDAETLECVNTIDVESNWFNRLWYSSVTGAYVLDSSVDSYILDKDFEIISTIVHCVGEQDGEFVLVDDEGQFYKLPYVPYEELIRRADEMLKDYIPDESIARKYNIMTGNAE
ncbi:MAG: hypothetical protein J5819_05410, partial [Eubacterium sp.]|nr:hypothetical protein [Eubacterium sp.]